MLFGADTLKRAGMIGLSVVFLTMFLSGCVTTQGPMASATNAATNFAQSLTEYNPFDTKGQEFKHLVSDGQWDNAKLYFDEHENDYFGKHYGEGKSPASPELKSLAGHVYANEYHEHVVTLIEQLKLISSTTRPENWESQNKILVDAKETSKKIVYSSLFKLSGFTSGEWDLMESEISRVSELAKKSKPAALEATFDSVIATGKFGATYVGENFGSYDYISSGSFQKKALSAIEAEKSEEVRTSKINLLDPVLSGETTSLAVNAHAIKQAKQRIMADGRVDLSELAELNELAKKYGDSLGDLKGMVKVGYVDLTAASFRNRNVFDFEIEFDKDYSVDLVDAEDVLSGKAQITSFDYIFMTDLSAAKIFREFKNKREMSSRVQTGVQQKPNPAYVKAMTEYQKAMADMQSTQMQNAVQGAQPCYGSGFACALGGLARGIGEVATKNRVESASSALSNTAQTLDVPVFSAYNYELVDIDESKVARVDYYVIDVKKKKILSNYFSAKDHEKFTVSYNVQEQDPSRSTIINNSQKEEDVTNWEKRHVKVRVVDLFDPANLKSANAKQFTTTEAFLKTLSSKQYASADPSYGKGAEPKANSDDSQAIADERFQSVVIIKNSKSLGAGFYVTPDLVLTASHVVEGSNLVEMTFYDGTKTFGKVIDQDVRLDLALVKAQMVGKPVKIHSGSIRLGETAEAIGHPKGYEFTITRGVVSAVRKQKGQNIGSNSPVEFIQTDTPISPGNSGGPLFLKDAVIGVNDWVRVDKASQNLNFSVSYNEIRNYLDRFLGQNK